MQHTASPGTVQRALVDATARATLAPSIHNTQPWSFVVRGERLELYADTARSVPVVDPFGRQRAISCGAALLGARVALAAAGVEAVTALLPDPANPALLASITVVGTIADTEANVVSDAARLDAALELRHSNRRQYGAELVPDDVVEVLVNAALVEGAWLQPVRDLDDRLALTALSQRAKEQQIAQPAYAAELDAWTGSDPLRRDGVPGAVVPRRSDDRHDDIPIRDFDPAGEGELPSETRSRLTQTLLVLGTAGDRTRDWLLAGQALDRVLLELTSKGYVASILSQLIEEPSIREQLRHALRLTGWPQLVLRVGVAEPTAATPRLLLSDVLTLPEKTVASAAMPG